MGGEPAAAAVVGLLPEKFHFLHRLRQSSRSWTCGNSDVSPNYRSRCGPGHDVIYGLPRGGEIEKRSMVIVSVAVS